MSKKVFSKDKILAQAYELSKEIGLDGLSMRKIADRVGCSVMPLYDAFESKEELIRELSTFNEKQYDSKSNSLYDRYFKLLRDGLKYPSFFLSVVRYDSKHRHEEQTYQNLLALMRKDERLSNLCDESLFAINSRIELFTIGLVYTYYDMNEGLNYYPSLRLALKETIDAIVGGYRK